MCYVSSYIQSLKLSDLAWRVLVDAIFDDEVTMHGGGGFSGK